MSVQTIQVSSSAAIDSAVTGYLNQGFTVANRTDIKAIMQKNKAPLSAAMIILGLIVPIFGWAFLIGYLIIHGSKPASQVIEINLAAEDS